MKIKKLHDKALTPQYQSQGAVAFDLASCENVEWGDLIVDGRRIGYEAIIPTGLSFEVPEHTSMHIYPRSGWGFKHNIQLANGTGVIDRDYRGEVKVKLIAFCDFKALPTIKEGTRIAQAEIIVSNRVSFLEAEELSDTERGAKGFGSTGV